MECFNEKETQAKIIRLLETPTEQHKRLKQATMRKYEQLSYFEREEITRWLKKNLKDLPILSKTKQLGLKELLAGHYETKSALLLIRYAMQRLGW